MPDIPLIWTNDDIQCGQYDQMARLLDFLGRFDLKGTFFVVPIVAGTKPLTDDPPLVELLKTAMADGHEVHQHSVTHRCIENGIADIRMFELMSESDKIAFSEQRMVWERLWELDALEAHIGWGRQVWMDAFGTPSAGYRPGCGSFCGNMYRAAENLGFKWTSSRLMSMTGWMRAAGKADYPYRLEGPKRPYYQGGLIEFPILDDIAFLVPPEKIDAFVDLGWQHWQSCVAQEIPFLLVSHPFALERHDGAGYAIHEKVLPRILETRQAAPMTLHVYYEQVLQGRWPMAAKEDLYPTADDLPAWHALAART